MMSVMTARPPAHLAAALASSLSVDEVEPGIWQQNGTVPDACAHYDSIGAAYDLVGGLDIYHRALWGVSTHTYRAFAERAVSGCRDGVLLDAGCGSMLFTAHAHRANARGALIGIDASLRMLRLARARLEPYREPPRVALVHGNLLSSPFRGAAFDVVICLHVAHVLENLGGLLGELQRILKPGGRLFLTSVVLVNHWRDRYLRALSRRGVLASPRRQDDMLRAIRILFGSEADSHLVGSMLFVQVTNRLDPSLSTG
jgi:ubiquinone/menaquinone biosynthesis C-methylase UbiE